MPYIALPRSPRAWADDSPYHTMERPGCTVWEADKAPQDTGLLDAHGVKLYRTVNTVPMGFQSVRAFEP